MQKPLLVETSIEKDEIIHVVSTLLNQPDPKNSRAQMIRRIETAPEDVVLPVHNVLLLIEKGCPAPRISETSQIGMANVIGQKDAHVRRCRLG